MEKFIRVIDRLSGSTGVIGAWLVVPLIAATCYEVFSRYALNAPTIWAFELGYMLTGANFLIGTAYTLRERGHIRIDILYNHLPARTRAVIDVVGYVFLFLPAAMWLDIALWKYALSAFKSQELSGQSAWNPVIWPFRLVFFSGFLLLTLQGIAELIRASRYLSGRDQNWDAR